jgi:electron-transferring-flavoprotein dehydrogenase
MSEREAMPYDLVIVGAGPAGLSAAIRAKQAANEKGLELSVCVLEKGSEVGAHILSGAVIDPRALDELLPDWRESDCTLKDVPVVDNQHWVLTEKKMVHFPHIFMPSFMDNRGTYTGSLGNLARWLAARAEELGVEIFPGFAASEVLFHADGSVKGVATGDFGVARDGTRKPSYQPGLELHAKYTLFAEGVRGSLSKSLIRQFELSRNSQPQVYGIGIKELWDIPAEQHVPGRVIHTQGWPLTDAQGGGWIYHQANNQISIGFVTWLNYKNPYLSPFDEFEGRAARELRRACDQRRRLAERAEADLPRRGADRLLGGVPERAADQGHAHGHEERHDGRRGGGRRGAGAAAVRRAGGV